MRLQQKPTNLTSKPDERSEAEGDIPEGGTKFPQGFKKHESSGETLEPKPCLCRVFFVGGYCL